LAHQSKLCVRFKQTHLVENRTGIDNRHRATPVTLALHAALVHEGDNLAIELVVTAEGIIDVFGLQEMLR
jgi:hypothetical protein